MDHQDWEAEYASLPVWRFQKILLVPKASVRFRMCLDSQEYYNHFVLDFLQAEHLRAGTSLVQTFKRSRKKYVTKESLKERHPFSKEELYRFTKAHPEVLELYKKLEREEREVSGQALDEGFDVATFCETLSASLASIPAGPGRASDFHNLMIGAIEFIFYPHLIYPVKEREINEGRKRIDITYTNAARDGFFFRLHTAQQVASNVIMVECKNYSADIANPELDQLLGRFAINRGKLGLLVARTCDKRGLLIERCRDAALAGQGFIIPLFDEDIFRMLDAIKVRKWDFVDARLQAIFDELIH
jgi:hypothetical protein